MKKIAIIGAGISGITLATNLKKVADIKIFEKARGIGGRMSTRYSDEFEFDHGAQFFTIKTEQFKNFLQPLIEQGVVKRWDARFAEIFNNSIVNNYQWNNDPPHYVACPRMNQMCKYFTKDLNIILNTKVIVPIKSASGRWKLHSENNEFLGEYDWVISTAPIAQTINLMPTVFMHHKKLHNFKMQGCFALMVGSNKDIKIDWDAAFIKNGCLSWVSINNNKPDRKNSLCIVAQARNSWADDNINEDISNIQNEMLTALSNIIKHDFSSPDYISVHRWLYANAPKNNGNTHFIDSQNQLATCGDWFIQGRVESAFTSAFNLANESKGIL